MSEQNSENGRDPGHHKLLALLFAGFVLTGVATVIVGPLLPVFIRKWSLDDGQAGFFFTVQFAAAMGGTALSSVLSTWRGYRPALVLGYALIGAGLAALNTESHAIAMAAAASFGCGYGLVIPGSNLLVAEVGGARSASLLNLLNFAWGAGALACSPLILLALKLKQLPSLLAGFALLACLMIFGLLLVSFRAEKRREAPPVSDGSTRSTGLAVTMVLAALFFIYVAMENGVGGWAAEHAKRMAKGTTNMTTLAPMFFYAGLLSGRAIAPLLLLRITERRLVLSALSLTAGGTALMIAASTLRMAFLAVFLAGLGCSSIYPIYIAWLARWYGARAKRIGGVLFAMASLGGSSGPWFVGFVSKHSGSLQVGLLVPLISAITMICLVLLLRRQTAA
jgi:MFS transporter, FHS family, glucose/mannose:H+ symporter